MSLEDIATVTVDARTPPGKRTIVFAEFGAVDGETTYLNVMGVDAQGNLVAELIAVPTRQEPGVVYGNRAAMLSTCQPRRADERFDAYARRSARAYWRSERMTLGPYESRRAAPVAAAEIRARLRELWRAQGATRRTP